MGVFRMNKTKNYTTMSNHHFREKEMSLKAKGLLSLMLSLPNNWDYSISGLVSICKENETAIKSTLKELKEFGYLKVTKLLPNQTESKRIEYIYDVFERPQNNLCEDIQEVEEQEVEKLGVDFQPVENPRQLNTNKSSTKELSTNKVNTYNDVKSEPKKKSFQKPTIPQIHAYIAQNNLNVDAERFYYYYESNGWVVVKTKMVNWKACVHTWNRKDSKPKRDPVDEYMDAVIRGEVI